MPKSALEVGQNPGIAIAGNENALNEVGARQMQRLLGDGLAYMLQQIVGLGTEQFANRGRHDLETLRCAVNRGRPSSGRTPPTGPRSK